jgi:hypothetical protein
VNVIRPRAGCASPRSARAREGRRRRDGAKPIGALAALLLAACRSPLPPFPPEEPLWRDPDRRPFAAELAPRYSPHDWDHVDQREGNTLAMWRETARGEG